MNLCAMINTIEFAEGTHKLKLVAKGGYKRVVTPNQISLFEEHITIYPKNMSSRRTKTIMFSDLISVSVLGSSL